MRGHVPFLDTNRMPWAPGDMPGLFTKMLSIDPETGARTALQRIDPAHGYQAPSKPHFHSTTDEELFVLKGRFSFDSENWLGRGAYCFHPRLTVHGFKSAVAEESWFISRIREHLTFGFLEEPPLKLEPYPLDGTVPARPVCVLQDPSAREWEEVLDESGRVVIRRLILSRHPATGEGSMLVRFMPGWRSRHGRHFHSVYEEAFVLEGELLSEDGHVFTAGCYTFRPPRTVQAPMSSPQGALVYANFGGPLDFIPAGKSPQRQSRSKRARTSSRRQPDEI